MSSERQSGFCRQCGNPVQSGDKFCGVCGARVAPVTPEDPQVISRPVAAQATPARSNRVFSIAGVVGILLVLLAGGGAWAFISLGPGTNLFGGSSPEATSNPSGTPASTSSGTSPDPAFDLLLPPLEFQTTAPIMLPAELPNEFENMGINEDMEGDRYELDFLTTPPDDLTGTYANYEIIGRLRAVPTSEYEINQGFEATSTEDVELPDGTEAELSYMEPVEGAMYGPRWEGTFDRDGYTYTLEMDDYDREEIKQALSTMVEIQGSTSRE